MAKWFFCVAVLGLAGCRSVVLSVNSPDENIRMILPFFLVKAAVSFTEDSELCIDDLGGIDADLDLAQMARALRESGDQFQVEITEGSERIRIFREEDIIKCEIRQLDHDEDGEVVDIFLPISLLELIESRPGETISNAELLDTFKDIRGTLIEVHDGDEHIKISLR